MPNVQAISDLHGVLPRNAAGKPDVPFCDLLILAGDLAPDFDSNNDKGEARQAAWLATDFKDYLQEIKRENPCEIVAVAGNHDFAFERGLQPKLPWTYLQDRVATSCGLKLYGTPWCPRLGRWAFYGDDRKLSAVYEAVPQDVDILISHSPPYGYGDEIPKNSRFNMSAHDIHVGTHQLTNILYDKRPRAVVSGHIHEGRGRYEYHSNGTVVYNVAYLTAEYEPYDLPACTHLGEFDD